MSRIRLVVARTLTALAAAVLMAPLSGCQDQQVIDILTAPLPVKITVEPKGVGMPVPSSYVFRVAVVPDGADDRVEWSSSNPAVASISSSGTATCHADGTSIITAVSMVDPRLRDVGGVACFTPHQPAPQPTPGPAPPGGLIGVSTDSLSFTHVIGNSPCPQVVGEFVVTSRVSQRVLVSITSGHGAIEAGPDEFELDGGASRTVRVVFNCATRSSFETRLSLESRDSGRNLDIDRVGVTATIQ